mmetsp:Transcript_36524/g.82557  ORF Transcript_36524/g.82557 Transcript_36524/m.82557 type:complete len:276 (+) Transcript_36524:1518-2345(+)
MVLSSLDQPAGAGCALTARLSPASCCKNFRGVATSSELLSKPLRRMKSSRVRAMRDVSCSGAQGELFQLEERTESREDQESFSLLKMAPPATVLSGACSCFERTSIAAFKFSTACVLSSSPPWNSFCCLSRRAVASARAALSEADSDSSSLMLVCSPELFAVRPSMLASSSAIFASESEMAPSFSYSLLLHQHESLSYNASSSSISFCSVFCMSLRRLTTRVTGVSCTLELVPSSAWPQVCSNDRDRAAPTWSAPASAAAAVKAASSRPRANAMS